MDFLRVVILPPVFGILETALRIYQVVLIVRIVLSWVDADPYNRLVQAIRSITDPYLDFFRRTFPLHVGLLDLSPILAFLALEILQRLLVYLRLVLYRA